MNLRNDLEALRVQHLVLSALFLSSACMTADDAAPTVVERDSAGVSLFEHSNGALQDTVPVEPVLTIGREGDPAYEFHRITGIQILESGNLVVADGGASTIRFFGSDGQHIRTVGQRGEGPAEFGGLTDLWLGRADTIVAHDRGRRRLVYFDSSGVFLDGQDLSDAFPEPPADAPGFCTFPTIAGRLSSGEVIIDGWNCPQFEGADGIRSIQTTLTVLGSKGARRIGTFRAGHLFERGSAANPRESYVFMPIGASLDIAAGAKLYVSEGADYEIRVFDPDGRLSAIYRESSRPPLVSEDLAASFRDDQWVRAPTVPPLRPLPERLGGYDRILVAHDGALWAQRDGAPEAEHQTWVVFSDGGRSVRRLLVPRTTVFSVARSTIWGYQTNELGVQTVVGFEVPSN